nr:RNA-directed DNA polymerase, eukaryota [Tanacetum cinerariifolium]
MPKKAGGVKKDTRVNEVGNPYVHVVKGQIQLENKESKATPELVLSDECLLSKDLSKSLFRRVKQFALLANIRKAIRAKEAPGWVPDFMEENDDKEQNDKGGFNVHESGQVMGYKMDGCMSNMTEITESQGVKEGESMNFLSLNIQGLAQKAKKDWVKELCVKNKMMWDYLTYEIGKWKGEVVIMGDFNEVRYKSDRFGSVFNVQGANVFNSFIKNVRLEERMEKKNMLSAKNVKAKYKDELEALEVISVKGDGNVEVVNKRMEVVNTLQKIDKICSSKMAQKAKVKWSIEGYENTSFFH